MRRRGRITLGLALLIAVIPVISGEVWLQVAFCILAIFLIVWGRYPQDTEAAVARIPLVGAGALACLSYLDTILSPRDVEFDSHVAKIVANYDKDQKQALRHLLKSRRASKIPSRDWGRFQKDGLVVSRKDDSGEIKPAIRDVVARALIENDD